MAKKYQFSLNAIFFLIFIGLAKNTRQNHKILWSQPIKPETGLINNREQNHNTTKPNKPTESAEATDTDEKKKIERHSQLDQHSKLKIDFSLKTTDNTESSLWERPKGKRFQISVKPLLKIGIFVLSMYFLINWIISGKATLIGVGLGLYVLLLVMTDSIQIEYDSKEPFFKITIGPRLREAYLKEKNARQIPKNTSNPYQKKKPPKKSSKTSSKSSLEKNDSSGKGLFQSIGSKIFYLLIGLLVLLLIGVVWLKRRK